MMTTTHSYYPYHPVLRNVSPASLSSWGRVIHTMVLNARGQERRWEVAAFDAAHADGHQSLNSSTSPAAVHAYRTLVRYRTDIRRLEMMLALEVAKRDMADIEGEIAACIDKGGNMKGTIIHRLFRAGSCELDYHWFNYVDRVMSQMAKDDQICSQRSNAGHEKWVVVTESVRQARELHNKRWQERMARDADREVRVKAVVKALKARGIVATGEYGRVTLAVEDIEQLLASN